MENIYSYCDERLLYRSRVHTLHSFSSNSASVSIKREDEAGFGISGYKKRKYASLIPYFLKNDFKDIILIGGINSNHIVGILQLLKENRIKPHVFLKENTWANPQGNAFLVKLLWGEQIHWIPRENWGNAYETAKTYAQRIQQKSFILPEGGSCEEALPGTCTLFQDIQKNEADLGLTFDHIFIDAGTGFTAAALFLMKCVCAHQAKIHTILMAGDEKTFGQVYKQVKKWGNKLLLTQKKGFDKDLFLYTPISAKSFGSVNQTILKGTIALAREEGLLTDPVYSTKLLMTAKNIIKEKALEGNILIIHSGGGTGLMGFQDILAQKLREE